MSLLQRRMMTLLTISLAATVRTQPFVASNGRSYYSVLGDPGMRWKPSLVGITAQPGPRMQLFFYSLCSKAMPANFTVIPAPTDTCEPAAVGARIGQGEVERTTSDDCCSDCLARPWCLAWTEVANGTCSLKDNNLPEVSPPPPSPGGWQIRSGTRGYHPDQRAPSPRYGNCVVDGRQVVTEADNAAQVPDGVYGAAGFQPDTFHRRVPSPVPPPSHRPGTRSGTPW